MSSRPVTHKHYPLKEKYELLVVIQTSYLKNTKRHISCNTDSSALIFLLHVHSDDEGMVVSLTNPDKSYDIILKLKCHSLLLQNPSLLV